MELDLRVAAGVVPLTALMMGACVSQGAGSEQAAGVQPQRRQGAPSNLALANRLEGPAPALDATSPMEER